MIPIYVSIRGLLSHDDTHLDFEQLGHSPVAVCGEMGTGKTGLVEALFVALYGMSPFYASGSLYDLMTQGGVGEASVSARVEHEGCIYIAERVLRDTGKTKSHKATLTQIRPWDPENAEVMLAGPKVKDFDAAVAHLFGPPELALATWMMSQSRLGDLCGSSSQSNVGEIRRQVFDHLIGTDVLAQQEARIAEAHRDAKSALKAFEDQLAAEQIEDLQEAKDALLGANETRNLRHGALATAEKELERRRTELRDASGGDDPLNAQIQQFEDAETQRKELAESVGAKQRELQTAQGKAAGREQAETDVARHGELKETRESLYAQQQKARAWEEWNQRARDIRHDLNNKKQVILSGEEFCKVDPQTRELAGKVESLRADYAAKKAENEAIRKRNTERAESRSSLNAEISTAKGNIERIEKQLSEKPKTPFGDDCAPCPLMQAWASLPDELASEKAKLHDLEYKLGQIEPDEPLHDLEPLIAEGQKAKSAAEKVAKVKEFEAQLADAREAAQRFERELAEHAKTEPEKAEDPTDEISRLTREIDQLAGASERLAAAVEAEAQATTYREELERLSGRLETVEARSSDLKPKAESARAALADREKQRQALREAVESAESRVQRCRDEADEATRDVARAESRVHEIERRQAERAERVEAAKAKRLECESLDWLRGCFGKKGVRQILIDAKVPDLESVCDQLFDLATGGRFRLSITTQRLLDDGVTRVEDFGIRVRDERGERDVLGYSGGQRNLIRIIVRIGVLLWHKQITGRPAELLILDEAFDNLGAEGTESLLHVLDFVAEDIKRIIVVTHDRNIAARLPGRVFLENRAHGVEITTGEPGRESEAA